MQEPTVAGDATPKQPREPEARSAEPASEQEGLETSWDPETGAAGARETAQGATDSGDDARTGERAVVALPGMHRQEQPKTSFWKRIRLSRRGLSAATADDRMISRLDAIASRVEAVDQDLAERIRQLDERFSEVWEVEEQLSRLMELREMLEGIQERQGRIDGRTRTLERRLSAITFLSAVAAAGALGAVAVALL